MSLRDQILQAQDLHREKVAIREWSLDVWVRTLTADERDAYEQQQVELRGDDLKKNILGIRARMVIACACDEQGIAIFTDADAEALGKKSAKAMNRIFNVAAKLNGLTPDDVESLAKN